MPTSTRRNTLSREIAAARKAESAARSAGLRAAAARYAAARRQVIVRLVNGVEVAFPLPTFPALAGATPAQIARVAVSPSGAGIEWDELDAHYSVPGLLASLADPEALAAELGRRGGQTTSTAKAEAARANGARGGRPRLTGRRSRRARG
jgi:hypothetical protein